MGSKKYLLIVFALILLITPMLHASVISEKTLGDFGYSNFTILKNNNDCKIYKIPQLETNRNATMVLQLKIDNYIPVNKGVKITTFLNSNLEATISDKDIKQNNIIYLKNINKNDQNLEICVDNNFIPRFVISSKSVIGNYLLPVITKDNFIQEIPTTELYKNTIIPVNIIVKNTGYDSQHIKVIDASSLFIKNSELDSSSGDVSFNGVLSPGETKKITYYIKTTDDTKQITPRAILEYTNNFGVPIKIYTDPQVIDIKDNPAILNAYVDVKRVIINKQTTQGKLILRNISQDKITNIYIIPNFDTEINLENYSINQINGNDTIEIPFTFKTLNVGNHKLNFKITYDVNNQEKAISTQIINLETQKPNTDYNTMVAILIIISAILLIWAIKL